MNRPPPAGILHVISTGQSLSTGFDSTAVSTTQPFSNVYLHDSSGTYDITNPNASTLSMAALVADARGTGNAPYPNNIDGENVDVAFANQVTRLTSQRMATSCVGRGGADMSNIQKGGTVNCYAAGIFEAHAFLRLATAIGSSIYAPAVLLTHGEADSSEQTATYGTSLATMQNNYQTDLNAIYGGTRTVPLIFSQQCAAPAPGQAPFNTTALQMLAQFIANPSLCILSGPKYQYPYPAAGGGIHLNALGYDAVGEKYAEVFSYVLAGVPWAPLYPTAFARVGNVVTVNFHVPFPPLVFDSANTPPHPLGSPFPMWAPGNGFEAYDTPLTISSMTGSGVSPIVVGFTSAHGLSNGAKYALFGVPGNQAANGVWTVTVVDPTHLSLNGSTGTGTWTANGVGFRPIGITSAVIQYSALNGWQVVITLSQTPTEPGFSLSYAHIADVMTIGQFTGGFANLNGLGAAGRCGLLRDSDQFVGPTGWPGWNWCVEFSQVIL